MEKGFKIETELCNVCLLVRLFGITNQTAAVAAKSYSPLLVGQMIQYVYVYSD